MVLKGPDKHLWVGLWKESHCVGPNLSAHRVRTVSDILMYSQFLLDWLIPSSWILLLHISLQMVYVFYKNNNEIFSLPAINQDHPQPSLCKSAQYLYQHVKTETSRVTVKGLSSVGAYQGGPHYTMRGRVMARKPLNLKILETVRNSLKSQKRKQ